ncbi:MAG TPA: SpoIIE family protein phosphatase [Bacteroidia bacterium]|jgi:serine phosphatase RsbU (regulator of sigma subunit)/HAMP domain-containing protein|nr:SpoIIE family protein phosphatase [Bacteroidia bacterium]
MKFRFTIGRKIGLGFAVLILLTLIGFGATLLTIKKSSAINNEINQLYTPSVSALQELNLLVVRSKMLIGNWVHTQKDGEDKDKLKSLIQKEYPVLKDNILSLAYNKRMEAKLPEWSEGAKGEINTIFSLTDKLWDDHREVMSQLHSFDSYEDAMVLMQNKNEVEDLDGTINVKTRLILSKLDSLISQQQKSANDKSGEMRSSFSTLQGVVVTLGVALPLGGIIIALLTVQTIVRPIRDIRRIILDMGKGVMPRKRIRDRNDEIGEMSVALNGLIDGLKSTIDFADEVGTGNFDSYYKPLSEEDALGHALLKMRTELRENERVLEAKVIERTEEVVRQKEEIERQSGKLEVLYKHVTDSIRYAKRLQDAILPPARFVKELLPDSFVLFKPKDIVSGDFYWLNKKSGRVLVAAVDCTGHGVPGAFMSLLGNNMLNQVVKENELLSAGDVLNKLNSLAAATISQKSEDGAIRDGMDLTLCILDYEKMTLDYAGANNPLYYFRDGKYNEVKADKFPIGYYSEEAKSFVSHRMDIRKGDIFYIFSDGYSDQFGGPKGKKFMVNQFRSMLARIHNLPMNEQKEILNQTIETWKGGLEQVDDILVIGFRIS